ncbi:MAG: MocR-like pyridoxine biosynthesis transcription factor PdxR [Paracoccaceae bacterium]
MGISEATFFLDPNFEGTLQQQLQQLVIESILAGRHQPGERMPSSRKLAAHLGISRITVTLAYTDLVANDYLSARGRSGYFISENAPPPSAFEVVNDPQNGDVDWQRVINRRFVSQASHTRPEDWRHYRFPFIYGQADAGLFDHQNWRLCALQALGQRDFDSLTSDFYDGDDPLLIDFILRHILPRRGIGARPEEVLLTLGAQNALWLSAQILLSPNRTAALENPCYPGLRDVLTQNGCKMLSLNVDADGLPPEALTPDVDVVFTTPSHHAPTNATMPMARRRDLLERAMRDDFIVVEDDYEFEMSFQNAPHPALKSLDRAGRVIYIGSFSKSLFPGMRLGYLVGPKAFIEQARALRATVLRHPPGNIQRTLAYFLSRGHYDTQVNRMGRTYRQRRGVIETAIAEHGLEIAANGSFGGSSIWMKTPRGVDSFELSQRLHKQGVLIEPGRMFFPQTEQPNQFYRLAYSSIPTNRISEGIARIAVALD